MAIIHYPSILALFFPAGSPICDQMMLSKTEEPYLSLAGSNLLNNDSLKAVSIPRTPNDYKKPVKPGNI
jgi:hypothetical protein